MQINPYTIVYLECLVLKKLCIILIFLFVCLACSIDYGRLKEKGEKRPNIVFKEINVDRYESAFPNLLLFCKRLEMYSKDKMWVGEELEFRQLEKGRSESEEFTGKAALALIDEQKEEYYLGKSVEFVSIKDKLSIKAPSLYWLKREKLLTSTKDDEVSIEKKDEMLIKGCGFIANTASKEFELKSKIEGEIDTRSEEEKKADEVKEENESDKTEDSNNEIKTEEIKGITGDDDQKKDELKFHEGFNIHRFRFGN